MGVSAAPAGRREAALLFGTSFLVLFLELACIRYIPAQVRFFGYYTNFVLLAAFLGSGLGLVAGARARRLVALWPVAATLLFVAVFLLRNVVTRQPRGEFLWGLYGAAAPGAVRMGLVPTVLVLFALCALAFLPLGARLGELFGRFPPLRAYALDIGGGLAGVAAFAAVSRLGLPAWSWLALAFLLSALVLGGGTRLRAASVAAGAIAVLLALRAREPVEWWSPYYKIDLYPGPEGGYEVVNVNGSLHQFIVDFADSVHAPLTARIRADYRRPYAYVGKLDTVLVVGAGTGNDLNILLELGARHIDAVEIDPVIARLGRAKNPLRPYADPRVHLVVDDARAFLRRTPRHYDLIVFGTLDSQTLLSGMTSLRLDNYVYTVQCFRDARERLAPGGRLITYHMSQYPYIAARIHRELTDAFGAPPKAIHVRPHVLFNWVFVAGAPATGDSSDTDEWLTADAGRIPTDDWPYLYLKRPGIPGHYSLALLGVVGLAVLGTAAVAGRGAVRAFDAPMFFLGAGFLLVETKSVTEMALLFGSTWTVNVLVFAAILAVILAGNLLVLRGARPPLAWLFGALGAALAAGYLVPVRALVRESLAAEWLLGSAVVAAPILVAALIFPRLLERRRDAARALGWNVIGAIVGGAAEYASMALGIKALYLLAAAAYAVAALAVRAEQRAPSDAGPA